MCVSISVCVCLSICPSVFASLCISVNFSVCMSMCVYVCLYNRLSSQFMTQSLSYNQLSVVCHSQTSSPPLSLSDISAGMLLYGHITRLARPSVCPCVRCGLVTRKQRGAEKPKLIRTFPGSRRSTVVWSVSLSHSCAVLNRLTE